MGGIFVILVTDIIYYPEDILSLIIDVVILSACTLSFAIRNKYFNTSVLIIAGTTLAAMFYQSFVVPMNTTTSFAIILIVGFIISMLLRGKLMWAMHGITYAGVITVFIIQGVNPALRFAPEVSEVITVAITYLVLYVILSYCTGVLKWKYDQVHDNLRLANIELQERAEEIAAQNEELLQTQDNLNELNVDLERIVRERTRKIQAQNEILLKYSYTNAHHLRGPVARLLGLIAIYKLESNPDIDFFLTKMEDQTKEIDMVVKQINSELETNDPLA
jgi:signal transduction histidine kinase